VQQRAAVAVAPGVTVPGPGFFGPPTPALLDGRSGVAAAIAVALATIYGVLAFSVFFFTLQRELRSRAAAFAVAISVNALLGWTATQSGYSGPGLALGFAWSAMVFGVLDRFGPLGLFPASFGMLLYHSCPLTLDSARSYFGVGLGAAAGLVAIAGFAATVACGRFGSKRPA